MSGPKRWPPLLIPQLPAAWIRAGVVASVVASVFFARGGLATSCGFGAELCHPWLGTLGSLAVAAFWFWLLAPVALITLGVVHVARVVVAWLRLDVVRSRRG